MTTIGQTQPPAFLPVAVKAPTSSEENAQKIAGEGDRITLSTSEKALEKPGVTSAQKTGEGNAEAPLTTASLSRIGSLSALAPISMGVSGPVAEAIGGAIYKGNLHCHTTNSDGSSTPEVVAEWYRQQNYDFLMITDHNVLTALESPPGDSLLLIPGEEVSDSFEGKPIHLNGFNITSTIPPQKGASIQETLQNNVNAIRDQGGIAQLNHPFWKRSFDERHVLPLEGVNLLEVHNGTKECNNYAAGESRGVEGMWDSLLSQGKEIFATANDDAHSFQGTYSPWYHWPGRGWVMVQAPDLSKESVLSSLQKGSFYATTGVTFSEIAVTDSAYSVKVDPHGDFTYGISFIGKDGEVLKEVDGTEGQYTYTGDELYVRAKVISSDGEYALTQPYFLRKGEVAA